MAPTATAAMTLAIALDESLTKTLVPNVVRDRLRANRVFSSLSVRLVRTVEIVSIAKLAGFEALLFDLEHSSLSLETTAQLSQAALLAGICPLVRVPYNSSEWISRVLDAGAQGVVVPHIKTVQDVKNVVNWSRFYPQGCRSVTAGLPHFGFRNVPLAEANEACNESNIVIPMIETREALEIVDDIAAVPGIDVLLVGTNDLTVELGIPGQYDDPKVEAAYMKVIAAASKHGVAVGVGGLHSRMDLVERFLGLGARYVMAGTDQPLLQAGCVANHKNMEAICARMEK